MQNINNGHTLSGSKQMSRDCWKGNGHVHKLSGFGFQFVNDRVVTQITRCKFMNLPSDAVIRRHFRYGGWTFCMVIDIEVLKVIFIM